MEIVKRVEEKEMVKDEESQDHVVAEVFVEFIPIIPHIFIVRDCSFCTNPKKYKILPYKQNGYAPGHFVKIDGSNVSATATSSDAKAVFKINTAIISQNNNMLDVEIIESVQYPKKVIAIKNDKVIAKTLSKSPSLYTIQDVLAYYPEIVLVRTRLPGGSDYSTIRLYNSAGSASHYLGFGSKGKPLTPSSVTARQDEAKFWVLDI